jgi:putative DNA primase/helicase
MRPATIDFARSSPCGTVDNAVAYVQGRATDPDEGLRWIGLPNPDRARWDAAGFVGHVDGSRPVLIVEGPSDGLTVAVLDEFDVVAIRGATQARRVREVEGALAGRTVYIAADQDPAGRRFSAEVAEMLGSIVDDLRVASLPEGMDVGDLRGVDPATFGERLRAILDDATAFARPEPPFDVGQYIGRGATDADYATALLAYIETIGLGVAYNRAHGLLMFDGHQWHPEAELRLRGIVHRLGYRIRREAGDALAAGNADRAGYLLHLAKQFLGTRSLDRLLKEMQALPGVLREASEFDADPDVILAANGLVDLRTGQLRPVRKTDYITRRLAVDYRPGATAPRWERFLTEVFVDFDQNPDPELIEWMQVLIGYSATGRTSEEIFVLLTGNGGNGKSKFVGALEHVFGAYSKTTPFETLEHKPNSSSIPADLAALAGARFVFAHEAEGKWLNEGRLKAITGGDTITARFMARNFFSFRPAFQLFMSANKKPDVRGQDAGLWRRVKVVEFRATFRGKTAERDLADQLAAEAEGILAWAVEGARKWYAAGRRLPASASVEMETEDYRVESDILGEFLGEHLVKTGNRRDVVFYGDVWERYVLWADSNSTTRVQSSRALNPMLDERIGPRAGVRQPDGTFNSNKPPHVRGWRMYSEAEVKANLAKARLEIIGEGREPTPEEIAATEIGFAIPVPEKLVKYAAAGNHGIDADLSGYRIAGPDLNDVI